MYVDANYLLGLICFALYLRNKQGTSGNNLNVQKLNDEV